MKMQQFINKKSKVEEIIEDSFRPVELTQMKLVFSILLIGILVALFIVIVELIIINKCTKKCSNIMKVKIRAADTNLTWAKPAKRRLNACQQEKDISTVLKARKKCFLA